MNFFQHQDSARQKTTLLVLLLVLAVLTLVAITITVIGVFIYYLGLHTTSIEIVAAQQMSMTEHLLTFLQTKNALIIAISVSSVVAMGTLFKYSQLSGGGKKVAESLGGQLLHYDGSEGQSRILLNVVEEMAIASGNPTPPVYVLEESSINAFAAGLSRRDAVIGITRGCIDLLNRQELQGVIAHEFSHIHNGDMRLNTRLVALLHGILVIGLIGAFILQGTGGYHYGRRRRYNSSYHGPRSKNASAQISLGFALVAIGYGGTFFGNMIKAAVSRQREFLADASAVQYTRNPEGIGNALKKIGGYDTGSLLDNANAAQFSHMYFGQGIKTAFSALMATHPPLHTRIKRVIPSWNGGYIHPQPIEHTAQTDQQTSSFAQPSATHQASMSAFTMGVVDSIGEPDSNHLRYAQTLIHSIPQNLRDAAHQPFSARALIYCLLLDKKKDVRNEQVRHLKDQAHPATFKVMKKLAHYVFQLERKQHVALIEMAIPALKLLSQPQYTVFKNNLVALIKSDSHVSLFEWCVFRIIRNNTEAYTPEPRYSLQQLTNEVSLIFSLVVHAGKSVSPGGAFQKGIEHLGLKNAKFTLNSGNYSFKEIDTAIEKLAALKLLQKPRLLKALAEVIAADGVVTPVEGELYRAIADSLDCPVPPLLNES
ncbi:M48 family metallopeptidase [Teredinibacter purpureus]|uniref:M48 family metallopeptidase n=1 Tax=Teredinibacter purpureus TaxID=2731756 RepID=UPI0005F86C84|nr:M48 family metallopeptidase [Teredinibacter purpureus]